jgi:hypothetical protein
MKTHKSIVFSTRVENDGKICAYMRHEDVPESNFDLKRQYYLDKVKVESIDDCMGIYLVLTDALGLTDMQNAIALNDVERFCAVGKQLMIMAGGRVTPELMRAWGVEHVMTRDITYDREGEDNGI